MEKLEESNTANNGKIWFEISALRNMCIVFILAAGTTLWKKVLTEVRISIDLLSLGYMNTKLSGFP